MAHATYIANTGIIKDPTPSTVFLHYLVKYEYSKTGDGTMMMMIIIIIKTSDFACQKQTASTTRYNIHE